MGEDNHGADAKEEEKKKGTGGGGEGEDDKGNGKATKSKQQQKKKEGEDGGDGKKKASAGVVVMRVDLHCDGCARKVVKAIRAAQGICHLAYCFLSLHRTGSNQRARECARHGRHRWINAVGVEGVAADVAGGTVTVTGKGADPWDLKDRIESRTHRPVAFVSPPNPPATKKKTNDGAADGKKLPDDNKAKSKTGDDNKKKNKEVITLPGAKLIDRVAADLSSFDVLFVI